MNFWRASVQDAVRARVHIVHSHCDSGSVQVLQHFAAAAIWKDATTKKRRHCLVVFGGESVAEFARAGRLCDNRMRRMLGMQRRREILAAEKLEMVDDWECLCFVMEMLCGGRSVVSGHDAEAVVLHRLKLLDV